MSSREWGGVDVLVARFAHFLRRRGIDFLIADAGASRLRQDLPWARFVLTSQIQCSSGQISRIFVPSLPILRDSLAPWSKLPDVPVFTWIVQTNDALTQFVPLASHLLPRLGYRAARAPLRFMLGHRELTSRLFGALIDGGGLALMDGATRRALEFFYPELPHAQVQLIPIPAPLAAPVPQAERSVFPVSIAYLGRMDATKWSALRPIITESLAPLSHRTPLKLIAVCEGTAVQSLADTCRRARLPFELHTYMPNDEARALLRHKADVGIGMGTSILDLAATGLPSVIIDPAVRRNACPQRWYRFLHETSEYTLGEFRDFPGYVRGLRSFPECLEMAASGDLGALDREYVATHHDPDRCFTTLYSALMGSRVTAAAVGSAMERIEASFASTRRLVGGGFFGRSQNR